MIIAATVERPSMLANVDKEPGVACQIPATHALATLSIHTMARIQIRRCRMRSTCVPKAVPTAGPTDYQGCFARLVREGKVSDALLLANGQSLLRGLVTVGGHPGSPGENAEPDRPDLGT